VLTALILLTFAALWLVWMIAESQWIQWIVATASLLAWNFLVVRAGEQHASQSKAQQSFLLTTVALFFGAVTLLALATIVVTASQNSVLFPGREAIHFMVISVPLMIWANAHLRARQEKE
jgi:hypothetical protein